MSPFPRLVLLPLLLVLAACETPPEPTPSDPCDPNPCTQAQRSVCVSEDGTARCLCDPGTLPRPSGACEAPGGDNCPEHAGDVDEPNDCLLRARSFPRIGPSEPERSISPVGDVDFYRFDAVRRGLYAISAEGAGALMPRIDVFDQGGLYLTHHEAPLKASLVLKAPATGPLFARVTHSPLDPTWGVGTYVLRLEELGLEDHGNSEGEATAIAPNLVGESSTVHRGRFEYPGDSDWFGFSGGPGQRFTVAFDPGLATPIVVVRGANGQELELAPGETSFELSVAGPSYLILYPAFSGQGGASYAFQFLRQPL